MLGNAEIKKTKTTTHLTRSKSAGDNCTMKVDRIIYKKK